MKKWKCIVGGLMLFPVLLDWIIKYFCWIWGVLSTLIEHCGWLSLPIIIVVTLYVVSAFYLIIKCLEGK